MIVIAPATAPQVYVPPLGGVEHPLAPEFMTAMRQRGPTPVGLWKIINALAKARNPDSRTRRRCWRLRYWGVVRELRRAGLLYRHGPLIALTDFAVRPRPRSPKRLSPTVGRSTSEIGGSNPVVPVAKATATGHQAAKTKVVVTSLSTPTGTAQLKSAVPAPAEISAAASALARRQRKAKRPWTGYLEGERVKRGSLVRVPTGEVLPAYVVLRDKVFVALPDLPQYAGRGFDRYDASQVRRVKLQEAQLLGALKPRAGNRPRGRPPTVVRVTPMNTPTAAGAAHPA